MASKDLIANIISTKYDLLIVDLWDTSKKATGGSTADTTADLNDTSTGGLTDTTGGDSLDDSGGEFLDDSRGESLLNASCDSAAESRDVLINRSIVTNGFADHWM